MDLKQYAGSTFIKYEDVASGKLKRKIAQIVPGTYGPVCEFTAGDKLTLNATNCKTLTKAFGSDSTKCHGKLVEVFAGTTLFKGEPQNSVLLQPINGEEAHPDELDELPPEDEIPF